MTQKKREEIISSIGLIVLGLVLLAYQLIPGLRAWYTLTFSWPMTVIMVAFVLLIIGLLTGTPDMLVPACIVGGIGGILYWQNATGNWGSWAYVWTLIPGFAGTGTLLAGVIQGKRKEIKEGGEAILTSAVLFVIFGALLGGLFSELALETYWPVILIVLGVVIFVKALISSRPREA